MSKVKPKQIWADMIDLEEYRVVRVVQYDELRNNISYYNGLVSIYRLDGDRRNTQHQIEKNFDEYFVLVSED